MTKSPKTKCLYFLSRDYCAGTKGLTFVLLLTVLWIGKHILRLLSISFVFSGFGPNIGIWPLKFIQGFLTGGAPGDKQLVKCADSELSCWYIHVCTFFVTSSYRSYISGREWIMVMLWLGEVRVNRTPNYYQILVFLNFSTKNWRSLSKDDICNRCTPKQICKLGELSSAVLLGGYGMITTAK